MSRAESTSSRKLFYAVLITVAAAAAAGRICNASRVYEPELARVAGNPEDRRSRWPAVRPQPTPMFSSNDRSRWSTVRALVDEGTFVIGRRDKDTVVASAVSLVAATDPLQAAALSAAGYRIRVTVADSGIAFDPGWDGVDKVLNPETLEYYSSKPPLLSTFVAGVYWLLQMLTGWTLKDDTFAVVRTILLLVNLVPFVIYLWLLGRLLERYAAKEWTRFFMFAAACFATLVTPFLVTFNNHTVATFCVLFAIYPMLPLLESASVREPEAPARETGKTLAGASGSRPLAPSAIAFAMSGFFLGFTVTNELPAAAFAASLAGILLLRAPRPTLLFFLPAALLPMAALLATNYLAMGELKPAYTKFGGPWYEYEGSHWRKPPPPQVKYGIDWAYMHESRAAYAFNVLVGHHGLFSLSPIWLLAAGGMTWAIRNLRRRPGAVNTDPPVAAPLTVLGALTLLVSVVVISFYLFVESDNYGGWTAGLRWLMWLTPLWLLTMLPMVDWLAERRWGRALALVLLGWSTFSVSYPAWNPWRHPWLYNLLDSGGYIPY